MNLHEYQAKQVFSEFKLPIPKGIVVSNTEEALKAVTQLKGPWVVKAQVHAGGRGKAGGVKLVHHKDEIIETASALFNKRLVTVQTDTHGQPIHHLLIEEACEIQKELYLAAVIDRSSQQVAIMVSSEGGVDIETVAKNTPEKIIKILVDPLLGVLPYQCRNICTQLKFSEPLVKPLMDIMTKLYKMLVQKNLSLVEINPLVITKSNQWICLDAKINVDDNALFKQPDLNAMYDPTQENDKENLARQSELNYIALEGNIGCMVNGAGLAMATLDLIKLAGGNPANFLDVGGTANKERVLNAFKLILSDEHVKAVLVNIFGGIVRCDIIAEGIMHAVNEVSIKVPVVVRLEGNQSEAASDMLRKSGLNIMPVSSLSMAVEQVVKAAKAGKV